MPWTITLGKKNIHTKLTSHPSSNLFKTTDIVFVLLKNETTVFLFGTTGWVFKKMEKMDFPGGPGGYNSVLSLQGCVGLTPGWGSKIPHA